MPINKFTTLLDLSRQSKIITGETATFDGKIQAGIPFSGYPTGVNVATKISLGIASNQNAVLSGNTGTTVFDVANPLSPYYNPIFNPYSGLTWSNPLFSAYTSGLTLPITPLSAETQTVGPFWTLTQTGYTGDYIIGTQYTGFSISYSFNNIVSTGGIISGFTNAVQENFSAGTLDYKGPLDYISSKENITVDGRLITNKITITDGASSATTNYILTQIDDTGKGSWSDLSSIITGICFNTLNVTNLKGCSPITIWDSVHSIGSSATGNTSFSFGSNTIADGDYSHAEGQTTQSFGYSSHAEGSNNISYGASSHAEGFNTNSFGEYSHAEGLSSVSSGQGSHSEGFNTQSIGYASHSEGHSTISSGDYSHAEGIGNVSSGDHSHAEGGSGFFGKGVIYAPTSATSYSSHAEGVGTLASESASHAEGRDTIASGGASHAEGLSSVSSGGYSHAEGYYTTSSGDFSHAEGFGSNSSGGASHAEGFLTDATANYSHAEGYNTSALGESSHAEGYQTTASGVASHSEGGVWFNGFSNMNGQTSATTYSSHAEGLLTLASGQGSHAEGYGNIASGFASHAEGGAYFTISVNSTPTSATSYSSHAEGVNTLASGQGSHAEGVGNIASGDFSHAEGGSNISSGESSHAEGGGTTSSGGGSHSEGIATTSSGNYSHAEGSNTISYGFYSHAEGGSTIANGDYSHSEGFQTLSLGSISHAEGWGTIAYEDYQHVSGRWNTTGNTNQYFIIGKGTSNAARSNAFRVDSTGNVYGAGATYNSGADYAEFFESLSGDSLPFGTVVELEDDKIKVCVDPNNAIGVISSNPTLIGNNEDGTADEWVGKYEKDEWGRYVMEDYSYEIPDYINESGDTIYKTITEQRPRINDNFDPNLTYTPRSQRPEWNVVGLVGQVRILKNQQIPSRWIKMKDINTDIALYLIR